MSKRIAYFSDGTWQDPDNNTNVYRLYKALPVTSDQVTYYDDGVGADATGIDRLIGGALGAGLIQKVLDGYTKIAHVYEPGDLIYLFGFSRGAYTVRSMAGMIASCGLPTGSFTDDCVTKAFAAYRDPVNRAAMLAALAPCGLGDATIQMIGAWDTVGALGIPAIYGGIDQKQFGFLSTSLNPDVKSAYHCLSIDEHRAQFPPTLWTSTPAPGQIIEQVWFSGCHCDVGGGTLLGGGVDDNTRLCDISLAWMAARAQEQGLVIDPTMATQFATLPSPYALDKIRDSWTPKAGPPHLRAIDKNAKIANSVSYRVQYGLTYTPGNLTITDGALGDEYTLEAVVTDKAF